MKVHANAPLGPKGRADDGARVLEQGWSLAEAAEAAGVSERTCSKWVARYRAEGEAGLLDRSSAPKSIPHRTPDELVEAIAALRRLRMTGAEIAFCLAMALSTVSAVLCADRAGQALAGSSRPSRPTATSAAIAGELLHVDVKKLGRDPRRRTPRHRPAAQARTRTRVNGTATRRRRLGVRARLRRRRHPPGLRRSPRRREGHHRRRASCRRAVAFYRRHGISVQRVMTDNGSGYRSTIHAFACRALGIRHLRTRPYRPRTNGKAERFIRTLLGGWAYGAIYGSSHERTAALDGWLWTYNHRRPHGSLSSAGRRSPRARPRSTCCSCGSAPGA